MLPLASHGGSALPAWLQGPGWMHHASHGISAFLWYHRALGLFTVIFSEELGIPLPIPGDVAIAFGGYLTARGDLNYFQAYLCVVGGAFAGSSVLFQLTRRYGRSFVIRLTRYLGQDPSRLDRA